MQFPVKHFIPIFFILLAFSLFDLGVFTGHADARSMGGGRSFGRPRSFSPSPSRAPSPANYGQQSSPGGLSSPGGFMRGLAGGLVGGAIGSMLFGGLASAGAGGGLGGSGIGLFQILILGGIGYFVYTRFFKKKSPGFTQYRQEGSASRDFMDSGDYSYPPPPPPGGETVVDGIEMIRRSDSDFDPEHFKEVAQDVFFQVQAGWMRRDIKSYEHLLDNTLARQYEEQFVEMRRKGRINKLENIAVRSVELVDAGVDGNEEFVSLLFKANLLDYTVDEISGSVVDGSMTTPVKFAEKWTWARPLGEANWKLAGVEVVAT
jgi:predicted lipid-binding transport protein (Tim44 family)